MKFPPPDEDNEQRVRRAQAGDPDALEELFALHCSDVERVALRIVRNSDDARDVAQDTWVRVMTHVRSLREAARFTPWLRRVTRNASFDLIARRNGTTAVAFGDDGSIDEVPATEGESPEGALVSHETQWQVWEALGNLTASDRVILLMREHEGLAYAVIAARLHIMRNTAEVRVFRAREKFRLAYRIAEAVVPVCGVPSMELGSLVEGTLDGESRDRVVSHLFVCTECRDRFRTMRVGYALCRALAGSSPSADGVSASDGLAA